MSRAWRAFRILFKVACLGFLIVALVGQKRGESIHAAAYELKQRLPANEADMAKNVDIAVRVMDNGFDAGPAAAAVDKLVIGQPVDAEKTE